MSPTAIFTAPYMPPINQIFLILLVSITINGIHHNTHHGSFKGKLTPAISSIRESMSSKLGQLRRITAERLANPHFAFMKEFNATSILSNITNATSTATSDSDTNIFERFWNWLKGLFKPTNSSSL